MTTGTTSLAAWLLEQIEADEAMARANLWLNWEAARCEKDLKWWVGSPEVGDLYPTGYVGNGDSGPAAAHIARHDPARVLAQCKAHRAIVERYQFIAAAGGETTELAWHEHGLFEAVGHLASIYADRPGFDTRWAV